MPQLEVTSRLAAQASLADYTEPALVVPNLRATDIPGVIAELSHVLQQHGSVPDGLSLCHAALNKELMESTAQSSGIAVPHARLSSVKRLRFALGCAPGAVQWGAGSLTSIRLVFLMAVPATDSAGYLHLLASIARLGQRQDIIQRILQAGTASGMISLLSLVPIRQSPF